MAAHILVTEDSEDGMMIATTILKRMGYSVCQATSGLEALSVATVQKPDLILMDYHLPGLTGIEATRVLKVRNETKHIPIIAVTADIYSKQMFLDAGCDAFLTKPIRRSKLLRIVHQVLSRHHEILLRTKP